MTVADLRSALDGKPDDALVLVDDLLVSTPGNTREAMLTILATELSDEFPVGSPDGPLMRTLRLIVEDGEPLPYHPGGAA